MRDHGWTRHGECNGCGACCETLMRDITVRVPDDVRDPAYWQARGFNPRSDGFIVLHGTLRAPCPQLTPERGCRLHGTPDKPRTCQDYPTAPHQIAMHPCSYWFTRGEEAWGGQASPYPTRSRGEP